MKRKISWFIRNFEEVFSVTAMIVMTVSLLLQIYYRYVVGKSLPWSEELSRFSFLFLVFMVISLSVKNKSHIRVTVQFDWLPPKWKNIMLVISDLIWFVFNCFIIYTGFKLYIEMGGESRNYISPVLGINLKYVYVILPIGFLMMNLRMIQNYYIDYFKRNKKGGQIDVN